MRTSLACKTFMTSRRVGAHGTCITDWNHFLQENSWFICDPLRCTEFLRIIPQKSDPGLYMEMDTADDRNNQHNERSIHFTLT